MSYDISFVDEFTDTFTADDDECDGHTLSSNTILSFRDEIQIADPSEHVAVRGSHPWEYRHYTHVWKDSLEQKREEIRDRFETDYAEQHIENRVTPEAISTWVAGEVIRDSNATPHKMRIDDYTVWIEILETDSAYKIMVSWEPDENPNR